MISESELQLCDYVYFQINTIEKGMSFLIPSAMC